MSGHVGDLSPKQQQALQQFREVCKDLLNNDDDDYYCLRWLRARNFDIQQAKEMMKKCIAWRKANNVDDFSKDDYKPPEFVHRTLIGGMYGVDKQGGPVWIYPFGNFQIKPFLRGCTVKEILMYMAWRCEQGMKKMREQSKKLGKVVETQVVIFDFDNFSMLQALTAEAVSAVSAFIRMYEANYPERLHQAFVINVPSLFSVLFNLIKPLLTGNTLTKVHVLGKGDNWKEEILKYVDADQLPKQWGGNCVDEVTGDPFCSTHITIARPITEADYRRRSSVLLNGDQGGSAAATLSVDRRSCHEVPVSVTQAGSRLCWEYETEDHDIGFTVVRAQDDPAAEDVTVLSWQREDSHLKPREGSILCEEPGTYVLKFDNTFSAYRSKKLTYTVRVVPPTISEREDEA
ncbi:SEC14-like protein 2 [Rhipicephalus sanguineus]|uniref:SEC14-like protein 2 n=1 Tax=Rhipicephalus sanguineus TaxID=34632 RepID=UPI001895B145|nr:SEC14-like protein 2 [Rhipicephalus sanguineus]